MTKQKTKQPVIYKGYEIVKIANKKIHAQLVDNKQKKQDFERNVGIDFQLMQTPPITFVFSTYDIMTSFIDQHAR